MKTFRNIHFVKRDYETSNIVACQASSNPDPSRWIETDEGILSGLMALWIEGGVRFFGYM